MSLGKPLGRLVNGRLDLTGKNFTSEDLGKIPVIPSLRELVLSDNAIETFRYLRPQPKLQTIIAISNPIIYLDGLSAQPALTALDFSECDIADDAHFRALVVASVGQTLEVLNEAPITAADREEAARLAADPSALPLEAARPEGEAQEDSAMLAVYIREHRRLFSPIAYNRAVLRDLAESGALPVVDGSTTDAELVRATAQLKKRSKRLQQIIDDEKAKLAPPEAKVEEPAEA